MNEMCLEADDLHSFDFDDLGLDSPTDVSRSIGERSSFEG